MPSTIFSGKPAALLLPALQGNPKKIGQENCGDTEGKSMWLPQRSPVCASDLRLQVFAEKAREF